jgi:hypothetical protein
MCCKINFFKNKFRIIVLILTFNSISDINAQDINYTNELKLTETRYFLCRNYIDSATFSSITLMRNENATFGKKLVRGLGLSFGYNLTMGAFLLTMPESISRWDRANKLKWSYMKMKMKEAFTLPPVIDDDLWYINYVGHPYQGGYYFNNLRSQGAGFWASAAYGLAQSMIWEYIIEGWFERPSIQDMIVTPLAGALVGELSHKATLQMQKNGFSLSEKIIVTLINPSWTINNGFKTKKKIQYFGL